jgi:hypothetical protein
LEFVQKRKEKGIKKGKGKGANARHEESRERKVQEKRGLTVEE